MNAKDIWTPQISFDDVSRKVESIRANVPILQKFPVDIDQYIEFDLKITLIPIFGLRDRIGAEAMISKDYSSVYVDNNAYMDERQQNRMRLMR